MEVPVGMLAMVVQRLEVAMVVQRLEVAMVVVHQHMAVVLMAVVLMADMVRLATNKSQCGSWQRYICTPLLSS